MPPITPTQPRPRHRQTTWVTRIAFYGALAFFLLWTLGPIYWVVATSFKSGGQLFTWPPTYIPNPPVLSNYIEAFLVRPIPVYFRNSLIVAAVSTPLSVAIAALAAFGLSRYHFRGKNGLLFSILPDSAAPDRHTYQSIFDTFYRGFFEARARTAIVHPAQPFEEYAVLVVPALYVADEALLTRLVAYAERGGHLLLTFHSGYADEFNRVRAVRAPSLLRAACGISYQEYSNLAQPLTLKAATSDFVIPAEARAVSWADGMQLEGATALAYYEHPHFERFPAITSQAFGKGRATYCGTLPNMALAQSLAAWVMVQGSVPPQSAQLPASVRLHTACAKDGQTLAFYTNWSWTAQRIEAAASFGGHDLLGGLPVTPGAAIELGAWDVKIIVIDKADKRE